MLRIRLTRTGKRGQPHYRIIVTDKKFKRDGRIVERIGHYNPRTDPLEYMIEEARALHWLSVGAQPSDAVRRLLVKQGTIDRFNRLRAGEPLEALVAEYEGESATEAESEEAPPSEETAAEAPAETATESEVEDQAAEEIEKTAEAVAADEEE